MAGPLWQTVWQFLYKVKYTLTIWCGNLTRGNGNIHAHEN